MPIYLLEYVDYDYSINLWASYEREDCVDVARLVEAAIAADPPPRPGEGYTEWFHNRIDNPPPIKAIEDNQWHLLTDRNRLKLRSFSEHGLWQEEPLYELMGEEFAKDHTPSDWRRYVSKGVKIVKFLS